jgi:hypothetical protein
VVRVVRVALANLAYQVTQVDLAVHASQVVLADLLVQKTAVPREIMKDYVMSFSFLATTYLMSVIQASI